MLLSPARLAAFRILMKIEQGGGVAVDMLHSDPVSQFRQADHRLTTELIYGVLRQKSLLDWYLAHFVRRPFGQLDIEARMALRLGAYQILFLSRVPPRAAVHQSVELVKQSRKQSAAGLINAVLRRLQKTDFERACRRLSGDSSHSLSILYSHPEWLVRRWISRWGLRETTDILRRNNRPPLVHFRSNSPSLEPAGLVAVLEREGALVRPHTLGGESWEVVQGDLYQSSLFQRGEVVVQDAGSQVIPRLVEIKPADVCLDLCSGTGGKASHMAQLGKGQVSIVGLDSNFRRLQIAKQRHGKRWSRLFWVVANGTRPLPLSARFDKVLVDVLCSGTGTLQSNPEIRWRLKPGDLTRLAGLQSSLLTNAASLVKRGGMLVYATCSLEPEENEEVVGRFLSSHPGFSLKTSQDCALRPHYGPDQFFRLSPPRAQSDGFFAAVMQNRMAN